MRSLSTLAVCHWWRRDGKIMQDFCCIPSFRIYQLDPFHTPRVSSSVWTCLNLKGFASLCGTMWHPNSHPRWHLEGPGGNPIFWNPPLLNNPGFGFEGVDSWRNSRKTHAISFRRWWENVLKSCKLVMKIHVSTSDFGGFVEHPRSHIQGWNSWMPYKKLPPQQRLGECWWTRIKHTVGVGQVELQ